MTNEMTQDVEVNTNDLPIRTIGFIVVFLVFGVFGSWSALAPLDSATLAPGYVVVKGNRKTIQHLEGGIVKDIRVQDGDQVSKGDLLMELDDTQARAELKILHGQLLTALATEARLEAERDERATITYPSDIAVADDRALEAMQSENQQFFARKQSKDGEIEVLEQRIAQLEEQARGLNALIKSKKVLLASYKEEIDDNEALLSEGFVDKARLRDLQRRKESMTGELAEHSASIAGIKVQIGETRLQILQLRKDFRTQVVDELAEIQAKIFDLNERIAAVSDRVERSNITAPVSGMVLGLSVHTLGGVVAPGTPILDLVPEGGELIVEAEVSPTDIDRLHLGLLADIRFSAFKSSTTPVIEGRLVHISADRLVNEQTGMPFYRARVEITEKGMNDLGELALIPGMPAEVLINTGARTLLEYLAQPATDAFARSLIED